MLLCSSPFSLLLLDEYLLKHTSVTLYLLDFSEGSAFRVNLRLLRMLLEALVCPLPFVCVSWPWAQLQPLLHPLLPHAPLCFFLSSHPLLCPVDATAGPMHHFLWVQREPLLFLFSTTDWSDLCTCFLLPASWVSVRNCFASWQYKCEDQSLNLRKKGGFLVFFILRTP